MGTQKLPKSEALTRSFMLMAVCFSLNHGCVTTVLSLASSELGKDLGGYSSGVLYCFYTLTALCGATWLVDRLGHWKSLVLGTALYCFYVAIFLVAAATSKTVHTYSNVTALVNTTGGWVNQTSIKDDTSSEASDFGWPIAIIGSILGGIAAGFLWTAQGGYFATCAQLIATASAEEKEQVTGRLGSIFAGIYLGCELLLKLLVTLLLGLSWSGAKLLCFFVFTIIAVVSSALMLLVTDLSVYLPEKGPGSTTGMWYDKAFSAFRLMQRNRKMPLMFFQNAAFGFTSSFIVYYVSASVIKPQLSEADIGLFGAIISGTAAVASFLLGKVAERVGKAATMVLGALCYVVFTLSFLGFTPEQLGHWSVLVPLYVVFGFGRATFESTNKAMFADYFPEDKDAAFATVIVFSGGASSVAFFVFPHMTRAAMAICCLAAAALTIVSVPAVATMHRNEVEHQDITDDGVESSKAYADFGKLEEGGNSS